MCPSPRRIEIPKDLGWRQEVGPGAIKWLPLPPPGLARFWVQARHKRRVASVPTTLPPPPSALRRPAGRRGLGAGPPPPGRAGRLGHPWTPPNLPGALVAQLYRGWGAEEEWREKARLTWGLKAQPDSGFRLRTRQVSGTAGPGGRRWRSSELGSTSRGRVTPLATRPRAALCAVTAPRDTGTLCKASSFLVGLSAFRSRFACSPTDHTLSPPQPSTPSSLTLPPVTPPSASSHPSQPTCFCRSLRSELPLPEPPPLLGNPTVSQQRGGPRMHGS